MHLCYERPGLVSALNNTGVSGYDKWNRDRGGGAGGGAGDAGAWAARDRDRERERERQARAHQMSHVNAPEPDASSLFPAPFRVKGNNDMWAQQIHNKLGDYNLAHSFIEDTSKSIIGICAEPASPAPCPPSRRESEFKKPAHAPQNGRVHHHRPYVYNKSEVPGSTGASGHRPSKLLINGFNQSQNSIDSSQPPIESILKEMKDIPPPLSGIAATPRKETDNKFVFNDALNRLVQDNSQNNDLIRKSPPPKPGLDNRISNSRTSVSPDVNKDLCLSGSDDEVAATTTRLEPIVSPIVSGSPSSGSESSPSDSESDSSSGESSSEARAPAPPPPSSAPPPPKSEGVSRPSWSLSNFAPPAPHPASPPQTYDSTKELRHALADVKGKPSPISELSESPVSSPSPRRRRSAQPQSVSSDDDAPPEHNTSSPRLQAAAKRGRPRKKSTSEPPRKRGRPPKPRPAPRAPTPEPDRPNTDTKTQIFRKVFIPKNECGGKGGKGGKGKGGKGKGQVTIIEATAPESGAEDEERRRLEERRQEAIARLSPERRREEKVNERLQDRRTVERSDHRRSDERPADRPVAAERPLDRIPTERTSNDRMERDRGSGRMSASERLPSDRLPSDRHTSDRLSSERLPERLSSDRMPERLTPNRMTSERLTPNRIPSERLTPNRMPERLTPNRIPERLTVDRIPSERRSSERLPSDRLSSERPTDRLSDRPTDRLSSERLPDRLSSDRLSGDKLSLAQKMSQDKLDRLGKLVDRLPDRFVRAEADVGSGLKSRGSERLEEASSLVGRPGRARVVVQVPLRRLRADTQRALARRRAPRAPRAPQPKPQNDEVAATNHERSACADQTPVYYSYFECLPADALSDEERDSEYYLSEAKRLRTEAVSEQEPLNRVMLYLESVLCFVLTGRVLELEHDTKRAFTIYRETIEYIKSIHSMPSRFRASPHSTFSKLDILSLRVQALLYLRMFKMYNREVKDYYKIVQEYQQKPACAESVSSVSPLSPSPSPASVGSVGSGSASSGYCSLAHAVPATAHHALLQLTKYYTFLYVAHELWEQADQLCRMKPNQDLFIAVDRKCGPLTLSSSFRHLVQYVRHAITLLQKVPRE